MAEKLLGPSRFARKRAGLVAAVGVIATALVVGASVEPAGAAEPTVAVASAASIVHSTATSALSGSAFERGDIISDYLFFQKDAMTQAQIQTFLNAECPTNNCINVIQSASTTETSNAECPGGYTGLASESTAAILYKVEQLCGISAKALLVTLQKEQGLVTAQNPSSGALRAAMGYACPDTAPCSSSSLGFFRQIYDAAWQFQEYKLNAASSTRYPVGQVSAVRVSPTASCGSLSVLIADEATRGLYIYTPYTPNAAALANLGGIGNGCSSYGNRNFWVYWNNWFGNPLNGRGQDMIDSAYANAGGASGTLGALTSTVPCSLTSNGCAQQYVNGGLYWTVTYGSLVMPKVLNDAYLAGGGAYGALGWPTGGVLTVTQNGGGTAVVLQNGSLYASAAGAFAVSGSIRTAYFAQDGAAGALGFPTSVQTCTTAGCQQAFQGGTIYAATGKLGLVVVTAIEPTYLSAGGPTGLLGWPTSGPIAISQNGGGTGQAFGGGSIYSSPAGTFAVSGPVRTTYFGQEGAAGPLGWPTSAQTCTTIGCSQAFAGATIYQALGKVGFAVTTTYDTVYTANGGPTGALGWPASGLISIPQNGGGTGQAFASGSIYSSLAGTFVVAGPVRTTYFGQEGSAGPLGWPTAAQTCTAGGCSQTFQGGTIYDAAGKPGFAVITAINAAYLVVGGPSGVLGWPTTGVINIPQNGGGKGQVFAGGSIYSSVSGAFAVDGVIRAKYGKLGGSAGSLGWPTANAVCTSVSVCSQTFQHGALRWP